jgi:hypothetical protein
VGEVEPGGTLVVEVGESPLFEFVGAVGILGDKAGVADKKSRPRVLSRASSVTACGGITLSTSVGLAGSLGNATFTLMARDGVAAYYVPRPRAIGGAGEFEDFGAGPFGRIEPGGAEVVEFLGRCRNRPPLRLWDRRGWKCSKYFKS